MGCPQCREWRERSGLRTARPYSVWALPQAPRLRIGSSSPACQGARAGHGRPNRSCGLPPRGYRRGSEGRPAALPRSPRCWPRRKGALPTRSDTKVRASCWCPPVSSPNGQAPASIGKVNARQCGVRPLSWPPKGGIPGVRRRPARHGLMANAPAQHWTLGGGRVGGRCAACSRAEARVRDGQCMRPPAEALRLFPLHRQRQSRLGVSWRCRSGSGSPLLATMVAAAGRGLAHCARREKLAPLPRSSLRLRRRWPIANYRDIDEGGMVDMLAPFGGHCIFIFWGGLRLRLGLGRPRQMILSPALGQLGALIEPASQRLRPRPHLARALLPAVTCWTASIVDRSPPSGLSRCSLRFSPMARKSSCGLAWSGRNLRNWELTRHEWPGRSGFW